MARPTIGPELRFKVTPEVKAKLDAYAEALNKPWYEVARDWMELLPAPEQVREAWAARLAEDDGG